MNEEITVVLKSGITIIGKYRSDEYDDIYLAWSNKDKFMTFSNCEILVSEVAAVIWENNAD